MNANTTTDFTRCVVVGWLLLATACTPRLEIAQGDERPDAAVVPLPPHPACEHEVQEVGELIVAEGGRPPADLVRWNRGALLVRAHTSGGSTKVTIDRISRQGSLERTGQSTETGAPGPVLALEAIAAGGSLLVALTRPEGRVDVLSLELDGTTASPPRSLATGRTGQAKILVYRNAPLIELGGSLIRADGSTLTLDRGEADAGPPPLPEVSEAVVAGETLGWLRVEGEQVWLDHWLIDDTEIISARIAMVSRGRIDLLWAGDRYLVGDGGGSDVARYVVHRPRGVREGRTTDLMLGGRSSLPRPRREVSLWAWDNAGPLHYGLAQVVSERTLRFVNVALSGQALDAPIYFRRERDITWADVVWDGSGYTVIWSERGDERTRGVYLVRFSCPDET